MSEKRTRKADGAEKPYTKPTFEREGEDYVTRFTFPRLGVSIRVQNTYEDSHRDIHGHVRVTTFDPKQNKPLEHIHWSKLNIGSRQSRAGLANDLSSAEPEMLDWRKAIEFVCDEVFRSVTAGPEIIRLKQAPMDDRPRHLVKDFLPLDQPTTVFADGGGFKGWTVTTLAIAVQTGRKIGPFEPLERGQVAIVDYDTIVQEVTERVVGICRAQKIPEDDALEILYCPMRRPFADNIQYLRRWVDQHKIKLLIVDHIAAAVGKNGMMESDGVTSFFDALRLLEGVTSVVLSHRSKGDRDRKDDTPYGSVQVIARSRAVYAVRRSSDDTENPVRVGLFNTKRNRGRKAKPLGVQFTFGDDDADPSVLVETFDPIDDPEFVAHASLASRIRFYARDGAKTVKAFSELVDAPEASVRGTLNRMKDMAPIGGSPRGGQDSSRLWGLLAHNGPPARQVRVLHPTGTDNEPW